jgi:hypothetical protein
VVGVFILALLKFYTGVLVLHRIIQSEWQEDVKHSLDLSQNLAEIAEVDGK